MHVLSSRILLHPTDLDRSRAFYRDVLGLAIYREFDTGLGRATVFFIGGGLLEVSGRSEHAPTPEATQLWLQVADIEAAHTQLRDRGATILREPVREPWGLVEMWLADPDGLRICVVQVPEDHPMRYRPQP
ncbi:VOC family protein [Salinactinospora qingdaonensis]|uniref:VOC family protein n=1 Tax=Salinactinospora qingdaonensis TaxID=702744 RepID=A0ABP7G9Z6_9ACTN